MSTASPGTTDNRMTCGISMPDHCSRVAAINVPSTAPAQSMPRFRP